MRGRTWDKEQSIVVSSLGLIRILDAGSGSAWIIFSFFQNCEIRHFPLYIFGGVMRSNECALVNVWKCFYLSKLKKWENILLISIHVRTDYCRNLIDSCIGMWQVSKRPPTLSLFLFRIVPVLTNSYTGSNRLHTGFHAASYRQEPGFTVAEVEREIGSINSDEKLAVPFKFACYSHRCI